MKICFYSESAEIGGSEKYFESVIDHFAKKGHDISVVRFKAKRIFDPRWVSSLAKLRGIFKKTGPELIVLNLPYAYCGEAAAAALKVVPDSRVIAIVHNAEISRSGSIPVIGAIRNMTARYFLSKIGHFICPSYAEASLLEKNFKIPLGRTEVVCPISNSDGTAKSGVEEIRSKYDLHGKTVVLCVSRLVRRKGLEVLLSAFKNVSASIPGAILMIVGEGYLLGKLKKQTRKEETAEKVIFAGFQKDVIPFYEAADVAVMPSLHESFSRAVYEAMAAGKPIVAAQTGGVAELLNDCGLLVPAGDIRALEKGIVDIISNKTSAQQMGEKAKERVMTRFSAEKEFEKLASIFAAEAAPGGQKCA